MPLVNISILKGKSPQYIKAIADSVNTAVIETMDFPADDRYQTTCYFAVLLDDMAARNR